MKCFLPLSAFFAVLVASASAQFSLPIAPPVVDAAAAKLRAERLAEFPLGPDAEIHPDVPHGRMEKHRFTTSRIFPGTERDYTVYIPAQYDPNHPACVMVVQDGSLKIPPEGRWRIPVVLDNLIAKKDIPVCIGIFIDPGMIPLAIPGAKARNNRSFEYDSLSDRYARFILEEILPEVGQHYRLAQDGNSRMIMGGSSGGMCALNAAWERPDGFQRVCSDVGSFTALRGGQNFAALVRATEPKPIRVFLVSGAEDLILYAGSWWPANLDMLAALEYAGYEVNHVWSPHGGHNDYLGPYTFPDALRWLWRDYPRPIRAGVNSKQPVMHVLIPGEAWHEVAGSYPSAGPLVVRAGGELDFASEADGTIYRITTSGMVQPVVAGLAGVTDLAAGAGGQLYACQPKLRRVVSLGSGGSGPIKPVWENIDARSVTFTPKGDAYVTDPIGRQIWRITARGERSVVARGLNQPQCARLTVDGAQLVVDDARLGLANLYALQTDGSLADGSPFFHLMVPDETLDLGGQQIAPHPKGWIAFATALGLQLVFTGGGSAATLPAPGRGQITGVAFGGKDGTDLFVTSGGRVYRRKIQAPDDLWY